MTAVIGCAKNQHRGSTPNLDQILRTESAETVAAVRIECRMLRCTDFIRRPRIHDQVQEIA